MRESATQTGLDVSEYGARTSLFLSLSLSLSFSLSPLLSFSLSLSLSLALSLSLCLSLSIGRLWREAAVEEQSLGEERESLIATGVPRP